MRTLYRRTTVLFLGLALVASACSSGGDAAETTPITPIPAAASPDTAGPDLTDLLAAPEAASTTATTSAADRAEAEDYVREFLTVYFEAGAARDWDAVYEASSQAFAGICPAEEYAQLTSSFAADPSDIEFVGEFEVSVVGDFATGRVDIADEGGTLPVEGLLAVVEADGWRVAINPCDVATKVASGDFSYPVIITTTTSELDAGGTPSDEAPIPDALTTTTTTPGATTTTTIPGTPISAADRAEIEAVLRGFVTAHAAQDWVSLYASVPPLFSCTPASTADALAGFHFSPTAVAFGPMTITGADDEALATFDVTYLDSFETVTIEEFGVWEWGGTWYAAVHPCTTTDILAADGSSNLTATTLLEETLILARALYAGAGDYDIPTSALNEITDTASFVESATNAAPNVVAYDDADQEVLIVTQSGSGRWYCIAEDAALGAHYGSAFNLDTVDTLAGCRSVSLAVPWSAL
jgi:hypothetical protein